MQNPPKIDVPAPNLLDKAIGYFAPKRAARRMQTRIAARIQEHIAAGLADQTTSLMNPLDDSAGTRGWGGYAPIREWRPAAWGPNDTHAITQENIRAMSRALVASDPIAAGAIHTNVAHVVGTGLSMKPSIDGAALGLSDDQVKAWQDDVTRRFLAWCESPNCDAHGRLDFYDLQSLALRTVLMSGDAFAMLPKVSVPGWQYSIAVQLIEADRICNRDHGEDEPGQRVSGVLMDGTGRPVAVEIASAHPMGLSGTAGKLTWKQVQMRSPGGRRNMLHLYEMLRPEQVRGVPYLAGVVEKLKQLSRYSEAELAAAVTAAAMTVFTRLSQEAFEALTDGDKQLVVQRALDWDGTVKPNTATNLLPGEEIDIPKSERPNANFDPFFLAVVRQIGVGLELPFEVLIKHFTDSYSAARAALLDAWRTFRRRRDWLAKRFCQPVYEEWLADEVAAGRVAAPGFFTDPMVRWAYSRALWIGDGPGAIDPEKEVKAAVQRIDAGLSTRENESILHDGVGWEEKHAQLVREAKARRADGLEIDPTVMEAAPPGGGNGGQESRRQGRQKAD